MYSTSVLAELVTLYTFHATALTVATVESTVRVLLVVVEAPKLAVITELPAARASKRVVPYT